MYSVIVIHASDYNVEFKVKCILSIQLNVIQGKKKHLKKKNLVIYVNDFRSLRISTIYGTAVAHRVTKNHNSDLKKNPLVLNGLQKFQDVKIKRSEK